MQLVTSWKDSVSVFIPGNAKLFGLVTLNAILQTYQTWATYWQWLIFFIYWWWLGISMQLIRYPDISMQFNYPLVLVFVGLLALFTLCQCARPSTFLKHSAYFFGYVPFFIEFLAVFLLTIALLAGINEVSVSWPMLNQIYQYVLDVTAGTLFVSWPLMTSWASLAISPLVVITCAFVLDSDGSLLSVGYSFWRGIKFVVYNYPFCLATAIVFWGIFSVLQWCTPYANGIQFLLWPLPVCTYINFYIKRVHEQFGLYFE